MKRFLAVMVLLGSAATSAQAQFDPGLLRDTPITEFGEADTELLIKTLNQTLDNGTDGAPVAWDNRRSGNGGHITPSKDPQGRSHCRKALVENHHRGSSNTTEAVFCKVGDKWKAVSE